MLLILTFLKISFFHRLFPSNTLAIFIQMIYTVLLYITTTLLLALNVFYDSDVAH